MKAVVLKLFEVTLYSQILMKNTDLSLEPYNFFIRSWITLLKLPLPPIHH